MASSTSSISLHHKKPIQIERRPKLLKDYLSENSNSCSSSGFKSFPRHQQPLVRTIESPTTTNSNNSISNNNNSPKITISAFQALINAVKKLPFTAVKKSPSFLPRSLSRKLITRKETSNKKSTKEKIKEVKISVRVKDILRWKSFRDVAEEAPPPLDCSPSPNHYTITTTGSIDSSCNSTTKRSSNFSWCESDFTAELLPSWSGKIFDEKELIEDGKKDLPRVGVDFVDATIDTARVPLDEDVLLYDEEEEDEIQSPISVFDFDLRENEEPFATAFDQTLANVERRRQNLIEKIKEFESLSNSNSLNSEKWMFMEDRSDIEEEEEEEEENYSQCEDEENEEERARELLVYVKATSLKKTYRSEDDKLLFDLFSDELKNQICSNYDSDIVGLAKAWVSGDCEAFEFEHYNREAYLREINKVGNWSKFEVELQELAMEIGDEFVGELVDELLIDLVVK